MMKDHQKIWLCMLFLVIVTAVVALFTPQKVQAVAPPDGLAAISGNFTDSTGSPFNGKIVVSLPYAGLVNTISSKVVDGSPVTMPIINGTIQGNVDIPFPNNPFPYLTCNGAISPSGTYYRASLYKSDGTLSQSFQFSIPLTSTFNIGAAQQTSITTSQVSFINAADTQNDNIWNGNNTFSSLGQTFLAGSVTSSGPEFENDAAQTDFNGLFNLNHVSSIFANMTFNNGVFLFASQLSVGQGVAQEGAGLKHHIFAPACSTAAAIGAICSDAIAWTFPFADNNYDVTCTGETVGTGVPLVGSVTKQAAGAGINLVTVAATAAAAKWTSVDCQAVHQ